MGVPNEPPLFDYKSINWIAYSTRDRSFIFRLYSGILYANYEKVNIFKIENLNVRCSWCGNDEQKWNHLMFECPAVRIVREQAAVFFDLPPIAARCWLLASIDDSEKNRALKIVTTTIAKHVHWCLNHSTQPPNFEGVKEWLRNTMDTEFVIAELNGKILKHLTKWEFLREKLF